MHKRVPMAIAAFFALIATAQAQVDPLAKCIADNTSGNDRRLLARWTVIIMASHPQMKDLSTVTPAVADEVDRGVGALFTRLLAQSCQEEVKAMVGDGDPRRVMASAFENLGRLAMGEIMADPDVLAASSKFQRYVDAKSLQAVFGAGKAAP